MPTKVATVHAHRVREAELFGELMAVALIAIRLRLVVVRLNFLEQLRIQDRRADAISATRPLSQVDQSAAVAAEREVLVCAQDDALACWTAKAESFLAGHT
jgi:hypothetical protein